MSDGVGMVNPSHFVIFDVSGPSPRAPPAARSEPGSSSTPETGDVLIDEVGRRSYITSIAYGPSVGKKLALGYLPKAYAEEGRIRTMEYLCEHYPINVETVATDRCLIRRMSG